MTLDDVLNERRRIIYVAEQTNPVADHSMPWPAATLHMLGLIVATLAMLVAELREDRRPKAPRKPTEQR